MARLIKVQRSNEHSSSYLPGGKQEAVRTDVTNSEVKEKTISELLLEQEGKLRAEFAKELEQKEKVAFFKGEEKGAEAAKQKYIAQQSNEENKVLEELMGLIDNLKIISQEVSVYKDNLFLNCRQELLELVFDAVLKLLGTHFLFQRDTLEKLISPLFFEFSQKSCVHIKLSRADYALLHSNDYGEFRSKLPEGLFFECCEGMEKLGVNIHTGDGELDLRLSTKLEQFKTLLIAHGNSENV